MKTHFFVVYTLVLRVGTEAVGFAPSNISEASGVRELPHLLCVLPFVIEDIQKEGVRNVQIRKSTVITSAVFCFY